MDDCCRQKKRKLVYRPNVNLIDALRKIRLLNQVKVAYGALPAEEENAQILIRALMRRFAVKNSAMPVPPRPVFHLSWVYWEHLLGEYGLQLRRFGKRGNAQIGSDRMILIRLDSGAWRVRPVVQTAHAPLAAGVGVETLREYLKRLGPRSYAFVTTSLDSRRR